MAVQNIATGKAEVLPPGELKNKDGKFDLLDDHCLSCTAKEVDERVLWLHGAPPCHTFTFARRTDKHGKVPILRDPDHPEGWGQPEVEEANALAERMAALAEQCYKRGGFFSIENQEDSYTRQLESYRRRARLPEARPTMVNPRAHGGQHFKPIAISTNAPWKSAEARRC